MEQMNSDYSKGILKKTTYEYNKDMFENLMEGKVEPGVEELAKIVGLHDILINKQ